MRAGALKLLPREAPIRPAGGVGHLRREGGHDEGAVRAERGEEGSHDGGRAAEDPAEAAEGGVHHQHAASRHAEGAEVTGEVFGGDEGCGGHARILLRAPSASTYARLRPALDQDQAARDDQRDAEPCHGRWKLAEHEQAEERAAEQFEVYQRGKQRRLGEAEGRDNQQDTIVGHQTGTMRVSGRMALKTVHTQTTVSV